LEYNPTYLEMQRRWHGGRSSSGTSPAGLLPSTIALDKMDSLDLKTRNDELCSGKNEDKYRCDLSTIPWNVYLCQDKYE